MQDDQTKYAPVLVPSSGLHWARKPARDHAPVKLADRSIARHIANRAGRLLCDGGPSVSRSVVEPVLASDVHSVCLHVYRRDYVK